MLPSICRRLRRSRRQQADLAGGQMGQRGQFAHCQCHIGVGGAHRAPQAATTPAGSAGWQLAFDEVVVWGSWPRTKTTLVHDCTDKSALANPGSTVRLRRVGRPWPGRSLVHRDTTPGAAVSHLVAQALLEAEGVERGREQEALQLVSALLGQEVALRLGLHGGGPSALTLRFRARAIWITARTMAESLSSPGRYG